MITHKEEEELCDATSETLNVLRTGASDWPLEAEEEDWTTIVVAGEGGRVVEAGDQRKDRSNSRNERVGVFVFVVGLLALAWLVCFGYIETELGPDYHHTKGGPVFLVKNKGCEDDGNIL